MKHYQSNGIDFVSYTLDRGTLPISIKKAFIRVESSHLKNHFHHSRQRIQSIQAHQPLKVDRDDYDDMVMMRCDRPYY
jgi:hypothetical protein